MLVTQQLYVLLTLSFLLSYSDVLGQAVYPMEKLDFLARGTIQASLALAQPWRQYE